MKQPSYKVRATREPDGNYLFSYGKGQKKITVKAVKDPANNKWFIDVLGHRRKISDLKKAWGVVAEAAYNGVSKAKGEATQASDQAAPTPMRMKQEGDVGLKVFSYDPNNERFRQDGHATPLGMLLEVQAWCERYKDRVESVNRRLAMERIPGFNPFSFLRMMIDECIEREIPGHTYVAHSPVALGPNGQSPASTR